MAFRFGTSVSGSCRSVPRQEYRPSATRFGQGASTWPRLPSGTASTSWPCTTCRSPTSYRLSVAPTSVTTARWSPCRISCCAPLGGRVTGAMIATVLTPPAGVRSGECGAHRGVDCRIVEEADHAVVRAVEVVLAGDLRNHADPGAADGQGVAVEDEGVVGAAPPAGVLLDVQGAAGHVRLQADRLVDVLSDEPPLQHAGRVPARAEPVVRAGEVEGAAG